MAHWKTLFDYEHFGCQDLPRDNALNVLDLVVTITKIERRDFVGKGGAKKNRPIADLKGDLKPLILNPTNMDILANLFGSTEYEHYIGKPITLYRAKVKNPAGSGTVDGIRIRDKKPEKVKVDFNPTHPRWAGAKQSISEGNTTVDQIREAFSLSEENEKLLTSI